MNASMAGMAEAVRLHQDGRLDEAERAYRAILAREPKQADAQHLLGVVALQRGDARSAIALIGRALELAPGHPHYLGNLATAHLETGDAATAIGLYRKALMRDPTHAEARYNLGNALRQAGDLAGAADCFRAVAARLPGHLPARNNHALCLAALGRTDEAIAVLEAAIKAGADYAPSYHNLGRVLHDAGRADEAIACFDQALRRAPGDMATRNARGAALAEAGRVQEAEREFDAILAAQPDNADALLNLGNLRRAADRPAEAEALLRRILARDRDSAAAHGNLALVLSQTGRHAEALAEIDRAVELRPGHADGWNNRGQVLKTAGRIAESIAAFDRALALAPGHEEARFGRAIASLLLGRFAEGWRDYRARRAVRGVAADAERETLPADLAGRTVAVDGDQGLGDEIFFLRFAAGLRARGARIRYRTDPRLVDMLGRAGIADRVVAKDAPAEPADPRLLVGDLPWLLRMGDGDAPPPPFAIPPLPDRIAALRDRLAAFGPPPHVGVTWRAGTRGVTGAVFKQTPSAVLASVLRDRAGTLVAVQRAPEPGEVAAFAAMAGRPMLDLTALNGDLEDMLALMALLDDYVAVSNTNVHLRDATGRRSRVLVPNPPEFRWMAAGTESPWFPGTRVYRQTPDGDWGPAFAALARDLGGGEQG